MLFRKRELTQQDYDINAVMVSLRMFPQEWVCQWPDELNHGDPVTPDMRIWMGHHSAGFYFERGVGNFYPPTSWPITLLVPWRRHMYLLAQHVMKNPKVHKYGDKWALRQELLRTYKEMKTAFDGFHLGEIP